MLGAMPTVRPRPLGSPLGSATVRAPRRARWLALTTLAAAGLVAITSCERRRGCAGEYCGTLVFSPFRSSLRTISAVTTRDSLSAVFRFHARYPEMFYDAVYHMRILPAHLLRPVPRSQWRSAALGRAPVGDGPYRFVAWKAGESVERAADSTFFLGRPRPGPSRPARPHLVDLGPRDPGAAVRHGPGRAVAHAARLARLERRRHPGPGRPSVGLPHPGANDEPAAAAVRAAPAGAVPS